MASDQPAEQEAGERLEWRVWPAAQRPVLSVGVGLVALGFCAAAVWSFQNAGFGLIGLIVLFAVLQAHYLPSRYRLDQEGIAIRGLWRGEWKWAAVR